VVQETTGARSNPGGQATLAGSKVKQEWCPQGWELPALYTPGGLLEPAGNSRPRKMIAQVDGTGGEPLVRKLDRTRLTG